MARQATAIKPVRLADVAKAAGVSHGTASNVFSHPEIVREEVRERVKAAADALGYAGPDPKGRLLRAGKVNAIGVATAEPLSYFFDDPFARVVMSGISEICDATGAGLSLVSAINGEHLAWNIQSALVDGFIVFCVEGNWQPVYLTRERKLPFVVLDFGYDEGALSAIGIDNKAGARLAADHLLAFGHRRFGVLALSFDEGSSGPMTALRAEGATYSGTRDRLYGYLETLAEAGIDAAGVPIYETGNDVPTVHASLDYMFNLPEPPTALLAMSDRIAMIAIDWLKQRGLSVPGDVSVVGFDGVPEAASCRPPLTTIAQPMREMGRRAARAILDPGQAERRQEMPIELVVRESAGPFNAR